MPPVLALIRAGGLTLMGVLPLWVRPRRGHPVLWAFLPVAVTYATSAIGGAYLIDLTADAAPPELPANEVVGLWIGAAFLTFLHLAIPLVVYTLYLDRVIHSRDADAWGFRMTFFALGWYGLPIVGLAAMTGWLTLIAAGVHLAVASRANRSWVFVEYGSTSFALLLFVINFRGANVCAALPIVLFQAALLAVLAVYGRECVVTEEAAPVRARPVKIANPNHVPLGKGKGKRKRRKRRGG